MNVNNDDSEEVEGGENHRVGGKGGRLQPEAVCILHILFMMKL